MRHILIGFQLAHGSVELLPAISGLCLPLMCLRKKASSIGTPFWNPTSTRICWNLQPTAGDAEPEVAIELAHGAAHIHYCLKVDETAHSAADVTDCSGLSLCISIPQLLLCGAASSRSNNHLRQQVQGVAVCQGPIYVKQHAFDLAEVWHRIGRVGHGLLPVAAVAAGSSYTRTRCFVLA